MQEAEEVGPNACAGLSGQDYISGSLVAGNVDFGAFEAEFGGEANGLAGAIFKELRGCGLWHWDLLRNILCGLDESDLAGILGDYWV